MAHFVIQTDGERGVLLVDGEQSELFGALVAVEVRRNLPLRVGPRDWPFYIQPREQPVVEVTLRLPLRAADTLTMVQGATMTDVQGPTVDSGATETGWRAEWDEECGTWRPIVKFPGSLAGTLAGSLQGYGFASKDNCLAFIRDNLVALGRMCPREAGRVTIVKFLTARFDEEHADAVAAQEADPAPWRADADDTRSAGSRNGHGFGLVIAADDVALWDCEGSSTLCMTAPTARHVARWDPARVLREVEAKRRLLTQVAEIRELAADVEAWFLNDYADGIEQNLAAPYAGHPDFEPRWWKPAQ